MIDSESAHPLMLSAKTAIERRAREVKDPLLDGFLMLCRMFRRTTNSTELTTGLPLEGGCLTLPLLHLAAVRVDLTVDICKKTVREIQTTLLPALLILKDGSTAALTSITDRRATIVLPEIEAREISVPIWELTSIYSGTVIFAAPLGGNDGR